MSARWVRAARALLAGCGAAGVLAALVQVWPRGPVPLRVAAGQPEGHRHDLAGLLAAAARPHGLAVSVEPSEGSFDALDGLTAGRLDAALIQGGLPERPGVAQVAALGVEPLHVLVGPALADVDALPGLRGVVNLSTPSSGTHAIGHALLGQLGPGPRTVQESSYADLLAAAPGARPDVVFVVSTPPAAVVERLVEDGGYRLLPVPWAEGLRGRLPGLVPATIPAGTYGIAPAPVPPVDLPTVGARLLLVARADLPAPVVADLLDTVADGAFRRRAGTPVLEPAALLAAPELPLHAGVDLWISRREPLLTSGDLEWIESLRSLLASVGVAAFFAWRWWRGRARDRFEPWFARVAALEARALSIETAPGPLDLAEIVRLRRALGEAKAEVLQRHADGRLDAPEQLATFLALVSDGRQMMDGLLLHARADAARGVADAHTAD